MHGPDARKGTETLQPGVVIIVVHYRNWRDTLECLETIFRLDWPNFRVLLVDNGSADGSLDMIRSWAQGKGPPRWQPARWHDHPLDKPIPYVMTDADGGPSRGGGQDDTPLVMVPLGRNAGYAAGANAAMRMVREAGNAKYVWLLNNDTVVDRAALNELINTAEADDRIGMVGSRLLHYDRPEAVQMLGGGTFNRWRGQTRHAGEAPAVEGCPSSLSLDYICGASMLVRMDLLASVGLMDERYFLYCEDLDWGLRARRDNWKLAYCPSSVVWHKGGGSIPHKSPAQDYYAVRNSLLLTMRYYPGWTGAVFLNMLPRSFLPKILRCQWARLRLTVRACVDAFRNRGGRLMDE